MAKADPRRLTCQLGVGQAFIHVSYNPVGGTALDWLRNLCFRDQSAEQFYRQTIPLARKHSTASRLIRRIWVATNSKSKATGQHFVI